MEYPFLKIQVLIKRRSGEGWAGLTWQGNVLP